MRIFLLGASGSTGQYVVGQGLEQGHAITAYVRNPDAIITKHPHLKVIKGEITDVAALSDSMFGCNAVISALGYKSWSTIRKPQHSISQNLPNILTAMKERSLKRYIHVSSFGMNDNIFWPEKILVRTLLKNLFADLAAQEGVVKESGLDWTIVRPARLVNRSHTGYYRYGEDLYIHPFSTISRADVADFLVKLAASSENLRKTISISY